MSRLWPLCPLTSISRHSPSLANTVVPDFNRYSSTTQHAPVVPFSTPQLISQQESSPLLQPNKSHTSPCYTPEDKTAGTSSSIHRSSYYTASPPQDDIPHIENNVMEEVDLLPALPPKPKQQRSHSTSPFPTRKSPLPLRTLSYTRLHPSILAAIQVLSNDASTQTDADLPGNDSQHAIERAEKAATALGESLSNGMPIIPLGDIRSTCSDSLYRFPTPIRRRRGYESLRVTIPHQSSCSSSSRVSEEFFRSRQEPCVLCGRSSPRGTETLSGMSSLSERHMGRKTKGLRGWWGRVRYRSKALNSSFHFLY